MPCSVNFRCIRLRHCPWPHQEEGVQIGSLPREDKKSGYGLVQLFEDGHQVLLSSTAGATLRPT